MSPFDFTKQIEHGKQNLIDENPELEKEYKPFIVNRALSFSHDMVLYANLMNEYNHLDSKLQFDFFLNTLRLFISLIFFLLHTQNMKQITTSSTYYKGDDSCY